MIAIKLVVQLLITELKRDDSITDSSNSSFYILFFVILIREKRFLGVSQIKSIFSSAIINWVSPIIYFQE